MYSIIAWAVLIIWLFYLRDKDIKERIRKKQNKKSEKEN